MKNTLETVKKVFTIVVAVIAIAMMIFTIVSVTTFNRNDRNLFGYKVFIVLSDSMKATDFAAGDIVVVKSVDPSTLEEGDIISYSSQDPDHFGETITHKIRSKTVDANGDAGFITYGTSTNTDDPMVVTYPYINGKYKFHVPKVGTFFNFLKTVPGYIVCILIPFLLLIGMQGLNTVKLFRQYKREQMEILQDERSKLAAERKQSEDMMAELMKLKAQIDAASAEKNQVASQAVAPEPPQVVKQPMQQTQQPPQEIKQSLQDDKMEEIRRLKSQIAALSAERDQKGTSEGEGYHGKH